MGSRGPSRSSAVSIVTEERCSYGCGLRAKFRNLSGKLMCATFSAKCPALRKVYAQQQRLEVKKVRAANGGIYPPFAKTFGPDVYARNTASRLKILKEQKGHCALCPLIPFWNGRPLKFQLDHIDGDRKNNVRLNLRLLCPNCHSQTDTFCDKNHKAVAYHKQKALESLGLI